MTATQDQNVQSCDKNTAVIHLSNRQRNRLPFQHELLDGVDELAEESFAPLVERHIAGDRRATDELIMGNLVLVKWLVGRYLYHWPETRRFSDDICSEGIAAVTEFFNKLKQPAEATSLKAILVVKIKSSIETLINDLRSPIHASLRTNFRRAASGENPEYYYAGAIERDGHGKDVLDHGQFGSLGRFDDTPEYIDVLDSLERLKEVDGEEMVDLVLLAIESQHNMAEADLTDDMRRLIKALADAVTR